MPLQVETYQSTILMQEKVINKMQTVIEHHFKSAASEGSSSHQKANPLLGDQVTIPIAPSSSTDRDSQLKLATGIQPQKRQNSSESSEELEHLKKKCSHLEAQV
jgi:hypothetical protein